MTLIKGGRGGDSGEKKDGSVSTLGKSSPERLEDSRGNSSVCWTGQEKIGGREKGRKGEKEEELEERITGGWLCILKGVSRVITHHMHK